MYIEIDHIFQAVRGSWKNN